ncbi:heme-dependent catalase [Hypoxylon sp. NC0597]|nr:heme-dependent catalase [Hypoxylon sp. NC0597]
MPLPKDEKVVQTSSRILRTLHGIFGPPPGIRPAHAKGVLLQGTFRPTVEAGEYSTATHFHRASTPVIARFSSSTGIPELPDTDPNGNPRGLAIRFMLTETPLRRHTDIVAHSVDGFPASNGEEALEFFTEIRNGTISDYLATHPKAQAFVQMPKPTPSSFGREAYYGVSAFRFIAPDGTQRFIRYRIVPQEGERHLSEAELKGKSPNFLYDDIPNLLEVRPIVFVLKAQVARDDDVVNDSTVRWDGERQMIELGVIELKCIVDDQDGEQKRIIFDPIPRVNGIEPSDDPLFEVRAGVYLMSGRERREA